MEIDFSELRRGIISELADSKGEKLLSLHEEFVQSGMNSTDATISAAASVAIEAAVDISTRMLEEYHIRLMDYLKSNQK